MTRILVLSDTHLPASAIASFLGSGLFSGGTDLFESLAEDLNTADLILHAGDHDSFAFYETLRQAGRLVAVHGNSDDPELKSALPERTLVVCDGIRIGLTHGWGADSGLPERVLESWKPDLPNVIVFGHTHRAYHRVHEGVLLFNPGSTARPRRSGASYGRLEVSSGRCTGSVMPLL
jgi:putative phosphoesterase